MLNIKKIKYNDFGECLMADNNIVKVIIPLSFGIRIINYSLINGDNLFCEAPDYTVPSQGKEWRLFGGHRIWYSPEANPRSYTMDEDPVDYIVDGEILRVIQQEDKNARMVKEVEIKFHDDSTKVELSHKIINKNFWDISFSLWCLTVMAAGGVEIIPFYSENTGLLHNRQIAVWPMTHMNDERVYWGNQYITLRQKAGLNKNFKIGINNTNGWAAYINNGLTFVKRFPYINRAVYPDNNVSFETYTCDFMTEIESLSPLCNVKPGEYIEHREEWEILEGIVLNNASDEQEIKAVAEKYLSK